MSTDKGKRCVTRTDSGGRCVPWNKEEYLRRELEKDLHRVQCLEIIPEHMTGKLVNES